jgi:hypothetical protein
MFAERLGLTFKHWSRVLKLASSMHPICIIMNIAEAVVAELQL